MMRLAASIAGLAAIGALLAARALADPDASSADHSHADHGAHVRSSEVPDAAESTAHPSSTTSSARPSPRPSPRPSARQTTSRFEAPAPGSYELPAIDRIAQHELLGVSGLREPLLAIAPGELALVSFVYLSCDEACPLSTALLHQLDRALAQDARLASRIELVTVSFDPRRDTPQAMAELRERMAPKGRWRFLTAKDEASLRPVLEDFGQDAIAIPGEKNAPAALRHVLKVFLVDGGGAVRQIYSTGFLDLRLVLADLRTLLPTAP